MVTSPGEKGSAQSVALVVEDDEQVRVLAESLLSDAGYKVIGSTGVDGGQALLQSDKSIELLFIDINLGNDLEAGLRFAQLARQTRPELPVLYTSGLGSTKAHESSVRGTLFVPSKTLHISQAN